MSSQGSGGPLNMDIFTCVLDVVISEWNHGRAVPRVPLDKVLHARALSNVCRHAHDRLSPFLCPLLHIQDRKSAFQYLLHGIPNATVVQAVALPYTLDFYVFKRLMVPLRDCHSDTKPMDRIILHDTEVCALPRNNMLKDDLGGMDSVFDYDAHLREFCVVIAADNEEKTMETYLNTRAFRVFGRITGIALHGIQRFDPRSYRHLSRIGLSLLAGNDSLNYLEELILRHRTCTFLVLVFTPTTTSFPNSSCRKLKMAATYQDVCIRELHPHLGEKTLENWMVSHLLDGSYWTEQGVEWKDMVCEEADCLAHHRI